MAMEGLLWGGCLESLDWMLKVDGRIPTLDQLSNVVMFLETSEEIPSAEQVRRFMIALGERGILDRISGLLVGRPKAWYFNKMLNEGDKKKYRSEQRKVISTQLREYNRNIPLVQNLDFGHTEPQMVIPYGGFVKVDPCSMNITFRIESA